MKLLLVDDSALVRSILKQLFKDVQEIEIIGEATNGQMAVEKNRSLSPDLIIMDINMPKMDGLEATKIIMEDKPVPIIIFSNAVDADNSYKAISYGAVDIMRKPDIDQLNTKSFSTEFINRILTISRSKMRLKISKAVPSRVETAVKTCAYEVVVIGASTGGPAAVRDILRKLPAGLPVPLLLVQHLESGFDSSFTNWLASSANMPVRLAKNNESMEKGNFYVAPTDKHLVIRGRHIYLEDTEKVLNQKPSVDVLFHSAAAAFKDKVVGILLTGMGKDGADGCGSIKERGGFTLVQDRESSTIFGMPKAAIDQGAASRVLPLEEIPAALVNLLNEKK